MSPLASLPDDQLLARLHTLTRRGNAFEAELLTHLAELDARRLYAREGCIPWRASGNEHSHSSAERPYSRIEELSISYRTKT